MSDGQTELLQGTLALLILKALLNGRPAHGYGIARWVEATTDDALHIEEGSLYPALRRIDRKAKPVSCRSASQRSARCTSLSISWSISRQAAATRS